MNNQRVIYYPPDESLIQQFAREVCQQLALRGDTAYNRPEVIRGFGDYLSFAAELIAKHLNEGQHGWLDNQNQQG
jgi:hypothetical protein